MDRDDTTQRGRERRKPGALACAAALATAIFFCGAGLEGAVTAGEIKARGQIFTQEDLEKLEDSRPKKVKIPDWRGYLVERGPGALRFSDEDGSQKRPPSPALPEFAVMSNEYEPYVIETPLPEDQRGGSGSLNHLIIDLEPHTVVSGAIETEALEAGEEAEALDVVERKATVLRPEEVLIYYETNSQGASEVNAFVPFSPALPTTQDKQSSVEYIIED